CGANGLAATADAMGRARDSAPDRGHRGGRLSDARTQLGTCRAPVLRNLTKQWLKLALELERTQASLDERDSLSRSPGGALPCPFSPPPPVLLEGRPLRPRASARTVS